MKRIIRILAYIVAGGILALIGIIAVSMVWLAYLSPLHTKSATKSPDGRYEAYVGYRGFLCNVTGHIYLREDDGRPKKGPVVSGADISIGEIIWSPDSRRLALLIWDYHGLDMIHVYDIPSASSGREFGLGGLFKQGRIESTDEVHVEWTDSETLAITRVSPESNEHVSDIAVYSVKVANGELAIETIEVPDDPVEN